jgi:hypothetical protein
VYTEPRRYDLAFAQVPGLAPIGVRVEAIAEGDDYVSPYAKVALRAPADGGGLRIQGWTYLSDVPLVTARSLDVVPGAVWIEAGADVRVHLAPGGALRVEAHDGQFEGIAADAPCGALQVGGKHAGPLERPAGATKAHAAGPVLHLYASPDLGRPVELRPETCTPHAVRNRGARRVEAN